VARGACGARGLVDAAVFLLEVVCPVLVEVAVAGQGAELEDGFGSGQASAGSGEVHAVLDEVAAGALDDAGGDGPALFQGVRVAQVAAVADQVVRGCVDAFTLVGGEVVAGGLAGGSRRRRRWSSRPGHAWRARRPRSRRSCRPR